MSSPETPRGTLGSAPLVKQRADNKTTQRQLGVLREASTLNGWKHDPHFAGSGGASLQREGYNGRVQRRPCQDWCGTTNTHLADTSNHLPQPSYPLNQPAPLDPPMTRFTFLPPLHYFTLHHIMTLSPLAPPTHTPLSASTQSDAPLDKSPAPTPCLWQNAA